MDSAPTPYVPEQGDVVDLAEHRTRTAVQLTFVPTGPVPAASWFAAWDASGEHGDDDLVAALRELELPSGEPSRLTSPLVPEGGPVRNLPLLPTVRVLAGMPARSGWPAWRRPSDSLLAWSLAAKLALEFPNAGFHLADGLVAGYTVVPCHGDTAPFEHQFAPTIQQIGSHAIAAGNGRNALAVIKGLLHDP